MQKKIALFLAMNLISNIFYCSDFGEGLNHLKKKDLVPREEVFCITCLSCCCFSFVCCVFRCPDSSRVEKNNNEENFREYLNNFHMGYKSNNKKD
jgi:hypothetical protein